MVNVTGHEGSGVAFVARLDRVEFLPTDGSSVMLHFEHGEALDLDTDLRAFLGGGRPEELRWLEFWMGARAPAVTIEAVHLPTGSASGPTAVVPIRRGAGRLGRT